MGNMKPGDKATSKIHGLCTVTHVIGASVGAHYDMSTYAEHTTDCWYMKNADGIYVAGNDRLEGEG